MNYVVWDIETDSAQIDWATMIEIGAILLDENFNEKERFTARCRMPQDRVPSATALCINKSNVDLITKGNLSHYQMVAQVEKKFREWSPATFMGFSSVGFDDEILRREFFKSLRKPYLINTEGNARHDALNIIKAAFAIDENILKTELNSKGNKSMKLESLARLNGFESSGAHSALFDTELTVQVLGLLKKKQSDLWHEYLKTKSKVVVENLIEQEKMFTINENFFGKNYLFLVAPLHPNSCMHPVYKWGQVVNLSANIEELQKLSFHDLKKEMKKSPRFYKTIKSNKAPIILDKNLALKVDPYKKIGVNLLNKRAELMKSNEKFSVDICRVLKEAAEEKMETSSQEDFEPEETIYSGGFDTFNKDVPLFEKFHSSNWKERLSLLDKFKDDRLVTFGHNLIFNEAPEILPKDIYKKIKRRIAKRILSTNKEKWTTCADFFTECDHFRNQFENERNYKKLNFLNEINNHVEKIQKKYEAA